MKSKLRDRLVLCDSFLYFILTFANSSFLILQMSVRTVFHKFLNILNFNERAILLKEVVVICKNVKTFILK